MKIEIIKGLLFAMAITLLLINIYLENKYPSNWNLFDELKYSIHPELRPKPVEEKEKFDPPIIICPECKGSGEKIQDVNKMMMEAKCAIWMNGHTAGNRCKDCKIVDNKYEHCEEAKTALNKFIEEYEKNGPEMSSAACPGCMGSGSFSTKHDGVWINQEQYEAYLEKKKNTK